MALLQRYSAYPVALDSLLAVSYAEEDHRALRSIFAGSKWTMLSATSIEAAVSQAACIAVGAVVCDYELPDGSWRLLREKLNRFPHSPHLIICSRFANDLLWAEVLNEGGWAVLAKPFDAREAFHAVSTALESWKWLWTRVESASSVEDPMSSRLLV